MVHKVGGSITVFLSFILVMILALIGTLLDVARIDMADSYSYRALVSAVDTEFTKYCSELYEDYHIYMLGNGHNESEISGEEFVDSMTKYLMCTFDSDQDLGLLGSKIPVKGTDLLELSLKQCRVDRTVGLTDYDTKIFQDQIAQYMKYYMAGNAAEGILEKLKLMQQSGDTMTVVRKKNEVDEEVSKVDKSLMKLMQEVEGITFKNNELVVTNNYSIQIQKSFAKKFCIGKAGPGEVGINHNVVWDSLKGHYIDPVEQLKSIQKDIRTYKKSSSSLESLGMGIGELQEKRKQLQEDRRKHPFPLSSENPLVIPPNTQPKDNKGEELEKLNKELEDKLKEQDKLGKQLAPLVKNIRNKSRLLYINASQVHSHTNAAIGYIGQVHTAKNNSISKLRGFESTLSQYKDKMGDESYSGIQKEYQDTKNYIEKYNKNGKDTSVVGNVLQMSDTLSTNKTILENTMRVSQKGAFVSGANLDMMDSLINDLIKQYKSYSIRSLKFDYSTLKVNEKTKSPFGSFRSLVNGGVMSLVIDNVDVLSKETISGQGLVSQNNRAGGSDPNADQKNNEDLAEKLKEQNAGGESDISTNLQSYENICESASVEGSTGNNITRKFLLNEYGVSSYINLMDQLTTDATAAKKKEKEKKGKEQSDEKQPDKEQKPTKLKYEQEYLVIGGASDLENAKSIVMRTLFMRTAVNYISLLTNSTCRTQAKGMATTLVGFTGFAPLIAITEQLILITWGFEEGLVDSRIMLDGKTVPFIKKAGEFSVKFTDLLAIKKASIKKKAAAYEQKKQGVGTIGYNDYVRLYLLMVPTDTLSYRMMDLIQENMRLRYDKQFSIANGIFGTKVTMQVTMPGKFLTIPFIKKFAGYNGSKINLDISTEYSY